MSACNTRTNEKKEDPNTTTSSIWTPGGLIQQEIHANNVTITRSGRMSLPPLARWVGQHYTRAPGSDKIQVSFETEVAKETFTQYTNHVMNLPKKDQKLFLSKSVLAPNITQLAASNSSKKPKTAKKSGLDETAGEKKLNKDTQKNKIFDNTYTKLTKTGKISDAADSEKDHSFSLDMSVNLSSGSCKRKIVLMTYFETVTPQKTTSLHKPGRKKAKLSEFDDLNEKPANKLLTRARQDKHKQDEINISDSKQKNSRKASPPDSSLCNTDLSDSLSSDFEVSDPKLKVKKGQKRTKAVKNKKKGSGSESASVSYSLTPQMCDTTFSKVSDTSGSKTNDTNSESASVNDTPTPQVRDTAFSKVSDTSGSKTNDTNSESASVNDTPTPQVRDTTFSKVSDTSGSKTNDTNSESASVNDTPTPQVRETAFSKVSDTSGSKTNDTNNKAISAPRTIAAPTSKSVAKQHKSSASPSHLVSQTAVSSKEKQKRSYTKKENVDTKSKKRKLADTTTSDCEKSKRTKINNERDNDKWNNCDDSNGEKWNPHEEEVFFIALKTFTSDLPDYWQIVAKLVGTRSEVECQHFHKLWLEEKSKNKLNEHSTKQTKAQYFTQNIVCRPMSDYEPGYSKIYLDMAPVIARENGHNSTLIDANKQLQMSTTLEETRNEGYEDDLFTSSPFVAREKLLSIVAPVYEDEIVEVKHIVSSPHTPGDKYIANLDDSQEEEVGETDTSMAHNCMSTQTPQFDDLFEDGEPRRKSICRNTKKALKCSFCEKTFICLAKHIKGKHRDEHNYEEEMTKAKLIEKVLKVSTIGLDESGETCTECGKVTKNMKRHMELHKKKGMRASCPICSKDVLKTGVSSHMRTMHSGLKPYKCPHCDYASAFKGNINIHIKGMHLHTRQHICNTCKAAFKTSGALNGHKKRVHEERKSFNRKSFNRKSFNQIFICSVCEKKFTNKCYVDRHMLIHTGEKPHKCTDCGRCFNVKFNLKSHIQLVHKKLIPYMCDICHETFKQKKLLLQHIGKIHPPQKLSKTDIDNDDDDLGHAITIAPAGSSHHDGDDGTTTVYAQVSDGTYRAMVGDASQVLQGQTFTTLQTDGGEETIIIVQVADTNEVTHTIVEQDGPVCHAAW